MKTANLIETGKDYSRIFSRALIPLALLVFMVPFVTLMFFATPATDDFAKATLSAPGYVCVRQAHIYSAALSEYMTGRGRWLANLLEGTAMSNTGLSGAYGWLLLLVMLTNIAGLAYFFASLLRVPPTRALIVAGVVYAIWLATFSSLNENIFWVTGAMEYQLPITSMLVLAGVFCSARYTTFTYILMAVLALAIPAQHEIAGMFLLACMAGGALLAVISKRPIFPWLLCLGLAGLSFGVFMLSPGMKASMAAGHLTAGLIFRIRPHAVRAAKYGISWILNPPALLGALCIPLLLWPHTSEEADHRPPRWLALASIGAICILLGEFADVEMASLSDFLPRVTAWFQLVFCILLVCGITIGVPEISRIRFSTGSQIGIFTLFALSLFTSGNFREVARNLRGPAERWHERNVVRLTQRGSLLQFDALPARPSMFNESGLSTDPRCGVNQCLAIYMRADVISLKGPTENHWADAGLCSNSSENQR